MKFNIAVHFYLNCKKKSVIQECNNTTANVLISRTQLLKRSDMHNNLFRSTCRVCCKGADSWHYKSTFSYLDQACPLQLHRATSFAEVYKRVPPPEIHKVQRWLAHTRKQQSEKRSSLLRATPSVASRRPASPEERNSGARSILDTSDISGAYVCAKP